MSTRTCRGAATSVAMNAVRPRNALFAATADDDRPTLASTMYASVLVYIDLSRQTYVKGELIGHHV